MAKTPRAAWDAAILRQHVSVGDAVSKVMRPSILPNARLLRRPASAGAPVSTSYMPHLDSLRALAISLVLVEHFGGPLVRAYLPLSAGALGVDLFFVLSGFLISGIFLAEFDACESGAGAVLVNFYTRRALRLVPVFYVTVAALYALNIAQMREFWAWHVLYLSNFLIAAGGPLTVFWSLSVEEQFYLLLPFVIILTPKRYRLLVAASIIFFGFMSRILALWLGINPVSFEASLPGNLEVLGTGVLLGVYSHRNGKRDLGWFQGPLARVLGAAAAISFALQLVIFYGSAHVFVPRYLTFRLSAAIFFGWLVLSAARGFSGLLGAVADHPAVRYTGRISYGIYVMHTFFPPLIWMPEVKQFTGDLPRPAVAVAALLLSWLVPSISWYALERPVLGLRRYFRGTRIRKGDSLSRGKKVMVDPP